MSGLGFPVGRKEHISHKVTRSCLLEALLCFRVIVTGFVILQLGRPLGNIDNLNLQVAAAQGWEK